MEVMESKPLSPLSLGSGGSVGGQQQFGGRVAVRVCFAVAVVVVVVVEEVLAMAAVVP